MNHIVSLEKCGTYNQKEVNESVDKLLKNLGGISRFVKNNQKVLLKPNIVKGAHPDEAVTTHPAVMEALIRILKDKNCEIFVGDDSFSDNIFEALKVCKIYEICRKYDVKIAEFRCKAKKTYKGGLVVKEFNLTTLFDTADVIINVPKLKTHSQLYFTGAVKNLYSMMPGPKRGFYHLKHSKMEYFANMLLDLNALLREKVVLHVTDGIYGMEGNGPVNGEKKLAGVLGASKDASALDFVMCRIAGLDDRKLSTIHYARKRKDFLFDENKIKVVGESMESIKIEKFEEPEMRHLFVMPRFLNRFKSYISKHRDELAYE